MVRPLHPLARVAEGWNGAVQGRGLEEKEARRLLQQLLVALQFVHDKGIANRDIKVHFTRLTQHHPALAQPQKLSLGYLLKDESEY